MARTGNGAVRWTAGAPRRTAGDGLDPDFKIPGLVPEAFFQSERHRIDCIEKRDRAETRGDGHVENPTQRAAAIDYIHWLSPLVRFFLRLSIYWDMSHRRDRVDLARWKSGGARAEFRSRFLRADCLADQRKQERLRHAHDREFMVYGSGTVDASTGSDATDTE